MGWGNKSLLKRSRSHDQDGRHALLLWNQKADDLETCYASLGAQVLSSLLKDDPGLILTYFMSRSNLVSYAFIWEKGKTMDF